MNQHYLMNRLEKRLYSEKLNTDIEANAPPRVAIDEDRADLLTIVKQAKATGNIDLILNIEKTFLVNDLNLYGNSKDMKGSLSEAIRGLDQTQRMVSFVRDPAKYDVVNESHALKKSRKAGVPYDEARKFFPGQVTRLRNMDKSRLSATEKKIITARQEMLRVAEKVYIVLQHKALGLEGNARNRESAGLERE